MAFSVNKAILVGNLTRDPELKYTQSGTAYLVFGMATNRSVKKDDQYEDVPTFHRVVSWGKLAEFLGGVLRKGAKVYVEGRIDNRIYKDKDGNNKSISEVVVDHVIPFEKATAKPAGEKEEETSEPEEPGAETGGKKMDETVNPEDIPF